MDFLILGLLVSASRSLRSLKTTRLTTTNGCGLTLASCMVSIPTIKPQTSLNFEISVFKKEKVSFAGHGKCVKFWFLVHCERTKEFVKVAA
ncbi:ketol-acid reductoisomerase, chloroplastic-like isoform X1 [Durio zibethinus]|uniref:Ketol-acid reductoisomerase, chloroplastic-like isoform X1 n=1 Tax=Durio zibethinus TaxID=66656 RepID=A0A6P6BEL4_DURZI|nr:ketol-acid reductoisomerase, chloroplastic-like isoform X1 [Durio zibethinus]